jgi:drug/metabolite transporter (DMT)-like permease
MNLAEQDHHNQQHLLLPSSATNDGNTVKTQRSSSVLIMIEPVMLITEEEINDDEMPAEPKSFALSGILYGLLGSFLFVTAIFIIKELQIDLLDALIIRFIIQIVLFAVFVIYHHYPVWIGSSKEKWLQFVLCILNGVIFLGYFISFRYLPLPDLTALNFTRLLWTVAFGILIYKEKATLMIFLAVCLTLIGVVFVAQPTFLFKQKNIAETTLNMTPPTTLNGTDIANMYPFNRRMIGISLSLATGLLSAFNLLIFKQLITLKLKTSVLILQHSFVFLLCLIFNQFYKYFLLNDLTLVTLTIFQWKYWLATLISLLQTLGVICGNRAVKREPASVVTIVSASDIIFAILLQNLFTKNKSNLWVLLGSTLVISSVVLIGVHKFMQERKTKKKKIEKDNGVKN